MQNGLTGCITSCAILVHLAKKSENKSRYLLKSWKSIKFLLKAANPRNPNENLKVLAIWMKSREIHQILLQSFQNHRNLCPVTLEKHNFRMYTRLHNGKNYERDQFEDVKCISQLW